MKKSQLVILALFLSLGSIQADDAPAESVESEEIPENQEKIDLSEVDSAPEITDPPAENGENQQDAPADDIDADAKPTESPDADEVETVDLSTDGPSGADGDDPPAEGDDDA